MVCTKALNPDNGDPASLFYGMMTSARLKCFAGMGIGATRRCSIRGTFVPGFYQCYSVDNMASIDAQNGCNEKSLVIRDSIDAEVEKNRHGNAMDVVLSGTSTFSLLKQSETRRLERIIGLSRGPSGKFENLIDVISDRNILIAAYQRLKAKPGLKIPELGSRELTMDWFRKTRESLSEGNYDFQDYKKKQIIRKFGARATQHSMKDRHTLLVVHLWALRTKKSDIYAGECGFYSRKNPNPLREFSLDFFLNYKLHTKYKQRVRSPWPPIGDLIVQEAMHMALEKMYEPLLAPSVHGYRPSRGCHTMFEEIKNRWLGVSWLLEFDIRNFFEKIDKDLLVSILEEEIQDRTFVELILKLFNVKALVWWDEKQSPKMKKHKQNIEAKLEFEEQGIRECVVAPLLCHIYMQKLDSEVLKIQEEQERLPPDQRPRSIFTVRSNRFSVTKQLPVMVRYVRYMDEFVVGVGGSRLIVEKVQAMVLKFLKSNLHLEPDSASYVDITFGSTLFLGMRLTATESSYNPRKEAKILEKRRRSKFRYMKLAQLRQRYWEERMQKLSLRAWTKGLEKARGRLYSLKQNKAILEEKAERMATDFAIEKLEKGETLQAVEELLTRENDVFYNLAAIGIPTEIIQAHRNLTELLERHYKTITKSIAKEDGGKQPAIPSNSSKRREMIETYGAFPIRLVAPLETIVAELRYKGMIKPDLARPNPIPALLNAPDEAIISYFAAIAYGLLFYYRCSDNYIKVKRIVDYQVRWAAIITLAGKHDFSPRKTIVEFKRGPQMVNLAGDVAASLPSSPTISRMGTRFCNDIQETARRDIMRFMDFP